MTQAHQAPLNHAAAGHMNYQQLTAAPLAWGTVYWAKSDHAVPLLQAGDVLNFPLLAKLQAHGAVLAVDLAIEPTQVLAMVDGWQQYKNAASEDERWAMRQQLLQKMQGLAQQGKTVLNLVAASAIEFLELPPAALRQPALDFTPPAFLNSAVFKQLLNLDVQVLRRSFLLAALVTYFGLGLGLTDYYFLKDLYRAALAAHSGLLQDHSFIVLQALAAEQAQSGQGVVALQAHAPAEEQATPAIDAFLAKAWQSFFTYPQKSVEFLQHTASYLRHDDVLSAVAAQQEGNPEGGMPQGLCFGELNDVEKLMAVFNHLLPFTPHRYQRGDFTTILKPLFARKNSAIANLSGEAGEEEHAAREDASFWAAVDPGFLDRCRAVLRGEAHE